MQRGGISGSSGTSDSGSSSGGSTWPRVYVSHGTGDPVLPVGCARRRGYARQALTSLTTSEWAGGWCGDVAYACICAGVRGWDTWDGYI